MTNDPNIIADQMTQEYGLDGAIQAALEATQASLNAQDNYSLSVWREVKRVLKDRKENNDA
jgi:hypothetical protein